LALQVSAAETNVAEKARPLALARALRPGQWTKNLFVLAPLLFGKALSDPAAARRTFAAAVAFCGVASAFYLLNDVVDREADARHPTKRRRPIASGEVMTRTALLVALALFLASSALAAAFARPALALILGYGLLTGLYSLVLKRVLLLDVFVIASGFVLRVLAGSAAAAVKPSHWLLLCTFFLALFLALSKRRVELASAGAKARSSLADVDVSLVDSFENVALGVTTVCYALYTVAPETVAWFGTDRLLWTVPFVVFGLFRWRLLETRGGGEDASTDLFTDRGLLATVVLWGLTCALLIYVLPR
ncbi:MAG TPA: UbiA prenyltransferase family protein, partial [Thermoanaerobaculia bacterium]|nr:UbiA prenyltransferase family protein [Thermoanaerobaculia bacterium]